MRLVLVLAACLPACASFSTHMTPRPTQPGTLELDAHIGTLAYSEDDGGGRQTLPNVELGIRYGLAQTVDIGGKIGPLSAELSSRIALLIDDTLDLSIVPAAGFTAISVASGQEQALLVTFGAPLLAGLHVSEDITVLLGGKIYAHVGQNSVKTTTNGETTRSLEGSETTLFPGFVVGVEVLLNENFALFPEVNGLFPYRFAHDKFARPVWQGGVAFQFRFPS